MGYRTGGLSENEVTLPSSEKVVIYMWGKFTLKAENCIKYPCAYMVKKSKLRDWLISIFNTQAYCVTLENVYLTTSV